MKSGDRRILTTHTGSLPRPQALLESYANPNANALEQLLSDSVQEVVRQQLDAGLDVINDGEFGKPTDTTSDSDHGHGVWAMYVRERLAGFEWVDSAKPVQHSKDRAAFAGFYTGGERRRQPAEPGRAGEAGQRARVLTCTAPISYSGGDIVSRDIKNLASALGEKDRGDAFLPVVSPASVVSLVPNQYYPDDDEYRQALSDAMRQEYQAVAEAGFIVHIDDPVLVAAWDWWPGDERQAYVASVANQIELLNHALSGIPQEQIRYHLCWGSWQGPHRSDLPLADIMDLILTVRTGAYVIEAANPRHEHEWKIWRDVELPDHQLLIPGVVTHKTSVVEHPEVVADRILRYADVVGRERVVAGTDCGMGGRISSDIAWAKIASLVAGARLASARLWS